MPRIDYKNKQVLLASKHEKERVIAPVFYEKLGCQVETSNFDTDAFGTFTGEVPRTLNAYETCVSKAKTAAKEKNYTYAIASEGSFGPHPAMPFVASDHEIMVFVDLKNDWLIAEQWVTSKTNYQMLTLRADTDVDKFLASVKFPNHAVTLQTKKTNQILDKGIQDHALLQRLIHKGLEEDDELLLATDMRAMMNPTRMEALSILAAKLAARILVPCPSCAAPGFGFISTSEYLPCPLCDGATSMYRYEVWGCIACDMKEKKPRPDQLDIGDPTYCNHCNP